MIEYQHVEVRFGDFVALPDFALEIGEGEFFTLLGPSGCGKSTALRTLAGLVRPTAGRIVIGGRNVTHLPSHRRNAGMVFQNYALFPTLSVGENIAFGLKAAKVPAGEIRTRVQEMARQVELSADQLDRSVAELSGGQQQRVAIARALVLRPEILLLDEPLSNLDAALRKQLRSQLKEVQQQFGVTTVYVTHDQEEALTLSDRIAVMRAGRIEQVGTPQEIYSRSATEFVCTFVGEAVRLARTDVDFLAVHGGSQLDAELPAYLRVEKVGIADDGAPTTRGVELPGRVISRRYHGMYSTYAVATAGGEIRAVRPEDGRRGYRPGEAVRAVVDPADVLQYAPARPESDGAAS